MKQKITLLILTLLTAGMAMACPVCKRSQPKVLRGVTHGAGPESRWDYVIIAVVGIIVLITLFFSVKWLIQPGEQSHKHIKRTVLNNR